VPVAAGKEAETSPLAALPRPFLPAGRTSSGVKITRSLKATLPGPASGALTDVHGTQPVRWTMSAPDAGSGSYFRSFTAMWGRASSARIFVVKQHPAQPVGANRIGAMRPDPAARSRRSREAWLPALLAAHAGGAACLTGVAQGIAHTCCCQIAERAASRASKLLWSPRKPGAPACSPDRIRTGATALRVRSSAVVTAFA
jgi:hypothetical protein